jgi:hypothetical protein
MGEDGARLGLRSVGRARYVFGMRFVVPLTLGLVMILSGCGAGTAELFAPRTPAAPDASGTRASIEQVRWAIRVGLVRKRWNILEENPRAFVARVTSGGHRATVQIRYNATGWTIEHLASSPGLLYREHKNRIHRRYNHWVKGLDNAIQLALVERR